MASINKVIIIGNLGRDSYCDIVNTAIAGMIQRHLTGSDHAPTLSISDDMPEAGGGGESATGAPEVAASDDEDGDGDPDSDRRRPPSKTSHPSFPPALLAFEPLSHYVAFGRSRIYQLIAADEFPKPIKVGKSSRWVKAEIDAWISKQATTQQVGG